MAGKRRSARKFGEPSIFSEHSTRRLTSNTPISNHISNPSCSSSRAANVTTATVTTTAAVKFIATEADLRLIPGSKSRGKGRIEGPKRIAKSGNTSNPRKRSRSSVYEAVSDDTEDSAADSYTHACPLTRPGATHHRPSSSPSSAHLKKSAGGHQCSAAAEHYTADTAATGSVNSKRRRREHHPSVVSPDRTDTCSPSRTPLPCPNTTAGDQSHWGEPHSNSSKGSSSSAVSTSRVPHRRRHPVNAQASVSAPTETGSSRSAVVGTSSSTNLRVSIPSQQGVVTSVMPSGGGGGGGFVPTSTNSSSNHIHSPSPPVFLLPTAGGNVVPANSVSGLQRTPSRHRHQAQQALFSDPTESCGQLSVQAGDGAYSVPPRNTSGGGGDRHPQTSNPVVVMPVDLTVPSPLHSAGVSTTSQPAGTASGAPMSSHYAHGRCQASMQPVVNLMHHCPTQSTPSHLNYVDGGYSTSVLNEDGSPCPSPFVSHQSALGPTIATTALPSLSKHSTEQFIHAAGFADHSVMQQCLCDTSAGVFQQGGPIGSLPARDAEGTRACSSVVQSLLNPINVARLVSLTTGQKAGAGASSSNSAAGPSTSASSSSSGHHRHSKGGGATVSGSKHSLPPGLLSSLDSVSAAAAGLLGEVLTAGHLRSSISGLSVSAQAPATVEYHPVCAGTSGGGVVLTGRGGRSVGTCAWSRAPVRSDGLPVAVGHSGINHRIAQLQQCQAERSLQIIILQDINQVLLMGFEENLVNLNFQGLVACVLEILGSEDDHLTEMKNLCCNVLTHMMDVLPRSSDAVVPALPLLLKTMSCSFVGDILERIINLLEQLSRRHGREVLQCGAISSVLEFYDFVTLAQHRTILSMVSNCFVKLGPADFDLIAPCLSSLSERLRESEPGCVERVCSCFVRLALAYHDNPDLLKRIVNSCSLLSNLQHLLMASPSILLRGLRDVLLMLTIFCSSPDLAVELMRQNISVTLHGILTGKPVDTAALTASLLSPIAGLSDLVQGGPSAGLATVLSRGQARIGSGGNSSQTSGSLAELSVASLTSDSGAVAWQPLLLTTSPAAEPSSVCSHVAIEHRTPEDIHAVIQFICELLPPIPVCQQDGVARIRPSLSVSGVYPYKQQQRVGDSVESSPSDVRRRQSTPSSKKLPGASVRSKEKRHMSSDNISITSSSSSSSLSTASSSVTLRPAFTFPYLGYLVGLRTSGVRGGGGPSKTGLDPRSQLLWDQCESLHAWLTGTSTGSQSSDGRLSTVPIVVGKPEAGDRLPSDNNYGLQLVQILLPLLFELFTETTKLQTRALCLDAIRCLLYFSSPILVAKVLNPSAVCSHLVGVLSSPDQNLVLVGLHIALLLVDRVPILFTAYFRKAGIVHQINRLKCRFYDSCELATADQPTVVHSSSHSIPSLSCAAVENALPPAYEFGVRLQLSTNRDNHVPSLNNNNRLFQSPKHQINDTPPRETSESDITWFIGVSCYQLQHQIYQIIPPAVVLNASSPSDLNDRDRSKTKQFGNSLSQPPPDNDLAFLDLMPKLITIASHLISAKPLLWVLAFKELIHLLRPFPCGSASRLEPPSPFELHNSGVTAALLAYLTETSHRETRLWIFYRLFFGSRARADRCLLPLSSQGPTSKRKQQHQTRLSFPSHFSLNKMEALCEIDDFLTSHGIPSTASSPGGVDEGQTAFSSLINCLLTCFHRHEHFQVSSVPSALSPDSDLFSLLHQSTVLQPPHPVTQPPIAGPTTSGVDLTVNGQDNSPSACQRTVASVGPRPRRQTSRSSAVATKTPDNQHSTCPQPSSESSGALAGGHEAALTGVLMSVAEVKHLRSGLTAAGSLTGSPASSSARRSLPIAGLLTIELVQLPTEETAATGDRVGSGNSATSSPTSPTGGGLAGAAKSGRKSSASSSPSSTSSNHSSTSSTLTMDSLVSLPSPLRIQITALATVQTLERLLLQRHSINALLHDYSTFHDHDYGAGLCSLANAYNTQSPQGVSDTRMSDDSNSLDEEQVNPVSGEPAMIILGGTRHRHHHRTKDALKRAPQVMVPADQIPINNHHHHHPVADSNDPEAANDLTASRRLHHSRSRQPDESDCHLTSLMQSRLAIPSEAISLGDSSAASGPVYGGLRSLLQRGEFPLSTSVSAESADQLLLSSDTGTACKTVSSRTLRRRSNINSSTAGGGTRDCGSSSTADSAASPSRHSFEVTGAMHASAGVSCSLVSDAASALISSRLSKAKQTLIGAPRGSVPTSQGNTGTSAGSSSSRQRRLRGSSLLAAFGMLSGLTSSSSYSQQPTADRSGSSNIGMGGEAPKSAGRRSTPSKHHTDGGPVIATSLYSHYHHHPVGVSPSTTCLPSPSSSTSSSNSVISLDSHTFNTGCGSSGVSGGALSSSSLRTKQHRPSFVFYVAGHQLPADMPLFEAIRNFGLELFQRLSELSSQAGIASNSSSPLRSLTETDVDELTGHLIWSLSHVIHYRLIHNTPSSSSSVNLCGHQGNPTSKGSQRASNHSAFGSFLHRSTGSGISGTSTATTNNSHSANAIAATEPCLATSTSSLSSMITCLKRRRQDEQDSVAVVDKSVASPTVGSSQSSSPASPPHPLYTSLTSKACEGFLGEKHCACVPSQCPGSANNELALAAPGGDASLFAETIAGTLTVLRLLHSVNRLWHTGYDLYDPFPIVSPTVFRSQKLAAKANRQLQDLFSVLAGNLPSWLIQLVSSSPFLFPFETRRCFFYAFNFDRDRALLRFQDSAAASSGSEFELTQSNALSPRNQTATASNSAFSASPYPASSTVGATAAVGLSLDHHLLSLVGPSYTHQQQADHHRGGGSAAPSRRGFRGRFHLRLALSPNLRRHKVTVDREGKRLLRQAETILTDLSGSRAVLEIAFEGEVGFGLGPTLEFYTLVSRQLMKASLGLWHPGGEPTDEGYLVAPAPGLYPRPLGSKQTRSSVAREIRSKFLFLGRLMARALLDWRQLDLSFSPAFFKWFLSPTVSTAVSEGHILPTDLSLVDPDLARHMVQLVELTNRRYRILRRLLQQQQSSHPQQQPQSYEAKSSQTWRGVPTPPEKLKEALAALDSEVDDLCLNFVLPGYEIDLVKNGSHVAVTGANLADYLRLVSHWFVIEGAHRQMEAVLEGFDSVLPGVRRRLAVLFQPDEMAGLFCGRSTSQFELSSGGSYKESSTIVGLDDEGWDIASLTEACRCDHGYTPQSRTIRALFEVMSEFDARQRRLFVQFITGSPRLPVGGFRALKPPLKIVMKREHVDSADNHLPSVMTCQNYLKLPDYSSKERLRSKLLYAINEGQNAFHLS